jgi:hypothetical protein
MLLIVVFLDSNFARELFRHWEFGEVHEVVMISHIVIYGKQNAHFAVCQISLYCPFSYSDNFTLLTF